MSLDRSMMRLELQESKQQRSAADRNRSVLICEGDFVHSFRIRRAWFEPKSVQPIDCAPRFVRQRLIAWHRGVTQYIVDPLWYKDAVIYELHVKTFCDSDGDGMGDFRGLIEKLDYLQELGITAIWLLPFYPSPLRDDGYDIADYFDVNPNFGTLDDFRAFLDAAHERNLRVITELVINHTSDQNPWFQKSRRAVAAAGARHLE